MLHRNRESETQRGQAMTRSTLGLNSEPNQPEWLSKTQGESRWAHERGASLMSPTLASPGSDLSNGTGTLNGDSRSFLVNEAGSPEYQRRAPGHNYGPIPNVFARETPEWMYEWARERQAQVLNTQRPLPTPPRLQEPQKAAPPVDRPEGVFQSAMRPVEAYGSAEYSASPARAEFSF